MNTLFPSLTMRTPTIEEPRFLHAGSDAAAITYRCREDLTGNGEPITGIFHVASLYTRIENEWRLFLWQNTPWKHDLKNPAPNHSPDTILPFLLTHIYPLPLFAHA